MGSAIPANVSDVRWSPRGVLTRVRQHVDAGPDMIAVCDRSGELTYRQLWTAAGWLAADLAERGVGSGDLVAVALDRSREFVVALLGVQRAGAAYVPLDPKAPAGRIADVIEHCQAKVVVHQPQAGGRVWQFPAGLTVAGIPASGPENPPAGPHQDPESVFYVGFTSGSTGRAKGVVIPHRAVERLATSPSICAMRAGDRVASLANPAFDLIVFEVWGALAAGATIVVLPDASEVPTAGWAELLSGERIDVMGMTTALVEMIAREDPSAFRTVRSLIFGGEVVDPEAVRRICAAGPPGELVNGYGPTEATTFATAYRCRSIALAGLDRVPIGSPIEDMAVSLRGAGGGEVPDGGPGEIHLGGPQVALGYLGRPDLTSERFVTLPGTTGRWYRTGDIGRLLPDGTLEFLGRADRQVKVRGFRVELDEVEQAVLRTGLAGAAAVEKIGRGPEAYLAGFVTPGHAGRPEVPDAPELPALLTAALREKLPDYMVPTRWRILLDLPLSSHGKVDRPRLVAELETAKAQNAAAPEAATTPLADGEAAPESDFCSVLCSVVAEVLRMPAVRPEDNFLDLGGTSILALQAASRFRRAAGSEFLANPADLLFADSLAELSRTLEGHAR